VPTSMPLGQFGPWTIERRYLETAFDIDRCGWPSITMLHRATLATLHMRTGEVVMEDSEAELSRHLGLWMYAHGRVLVSGLGLGCVVRGLLLNREVEHVDVLEICPHILNAVGPEFGRNARVTLHHTDALTWHPPAGARWDYAWHDIWTDGPRALQLLHADLMMHYAECATVQGAWAFPRWVKRKMLAAGIRTLG
jgi:spermidine synthase